MGKLVVDLCHLWVCGSFSFTYHLFVMYSNFESICRLNCWLCQSPSWGNCQKTSLPQSHGVPHFLKSIKLTTKMSHHSRQGEVGKQFSCGRIWVLVKCEDVLSSCIDGRHLISWQLLLKLGCYWLPFSYLLETYTWSSCALSLYTEFITVCCVGVHSAEGGFGSYLTHCIKDNYTVDSMSSLPLQGRVSLMFQLNSPTDQVIRYHRGNREQQRRNMHLVYNVI